MPTLGNSLHSAIIRSVKYPLVGNHDSVRFFIEFSDDFRNIFPDERLSPGDVGKRISGSFLITSSVISSSGLVGS